jgi:hypothetical protein
MNQDEKDKKLANIDAAIEELKQKRAQVMDQRVDGKIVIVKNALPTAPINTWPGEISCGRLSGFTPDNAGRDLIRAIVAALNDYLNNIVDAQGVPECKCCRKYVVETARCTAHGSLVTNWHFCCNAWELKS